ncbi:hypothetical protein [Amycolatopsis alba]|uniref:Uncharacterized protein n=1 Tax=Amycolatopsis alba DSM 44262 TaxID=1125972 RepID=A0A229RLI2_AMYAL|nr:hypothetical protein [Amycolatopsis alba]OXM47522.1 hypothetical protein CFP75_23860 [Amycolatopsis alba DSM 44262]
MALGDTPTLCGYRAVQNVGGVGCGDQLLETFDDQRLCARCHRALGPEHQSRAFEHPTRTPIHDPLLDTGEEAARG